MKAVQRQLAGLIFAVMILSAHSIMQSQRRNTILKTQKILAASQQKAKNTAQERKAGETIILRDKARSAAEKAVLKFTGAEQAVLDELEACEDALPSGPSIVGIILVPITAPLAQVTNIICSTVQQTIEISSDIAALITADSLDEAIPKVSNIASNIGSLASTATSTSAEVKLAVATSGISVAVKGGIKAIVEGAKLAMTYKFQKHLSCLLALPSDSIAIIAKSDALKTADIMTGGASGIKLSDLKAGNGRSELLTIVTDYYTTNYERLATGMGDAILQGDLIGLIAVPSREVLQPFIKSYAKQQIALAIKAVEIIALVKPFCMTLDTIGKDAFSEGPKVLQDVTTESNLATITDIITKYNSLMDEFDGTTTAVATTTVGNANSQLTAILARINGQKSISFKAVQLFAGLTFSVKDSATKLKDMNKWLTKFELHTGPTKEQLTSAIKALTPDATSSSSDEDDTSSSSLSESERQKEALKRLWMRARTELEYLALAFKHFGTGDEVPSNCRTFVTMASRFMTAIHAYEFTRSCADSRVCMSIDRSCQLFDDRVDRTCSRSCDTGCIVS